MDLMLKRPALMNTLAGYLGNEVLRPKLSTTPLIWCICLIHTPRHHWAVRERLGLFDKGQKVSEWVAAQALMGLWMWARALCSSRPPQDRSFVFHSGRQMPPFYQQGPRTASVITDGHRPPRPPPKPIKEGWGWSASLWSSESRLSAILG